MERAAFCKRHVEIKIVWPKNIYFSCAWIEFIDNRTEEQKAGLRQLLKELRQRYPDAKIMGHRDISPDKNHNGVVDPWERIKECPCFDAIPEYADI